MELWRRLAQAAGDELSDAQCALLEKYLDLLVEANATLNLTRIVDREQARVWHVADSLSLLGHIGGDAARLADIGSGGRVAGHGAGDCAADAGGDAD